MIRLNAPSILVLWTLLVISCLGQPASSAVEPDSSTKPAPGSNQGEKKAEGDAVAPAKQSGLDSPKQIRNATAPILAEMAEKHGYRLEPNQILCHVPLPFPELRARYYQVGNPSQAKAIPTPAEAMSFFWDGEKLSRWGMSFGQGYTLAGVLDCALKIKKQDIEGPAEFLNKPLAGDWVMRPDANEAQVLKELETILQKQFEMPVRLAFAKRVRTVYVARGKYEFTPMEREEGKTGKKSKSDEIEIYGEKLGPSGIGGGGSGDFKEFLGWVGRWIEMPLINEVSEPPAGDVSWHLNDDHVDKGNSSNNHDAELVLKNVAAQTGLTFKKEYRAIRRLLVEPIE